MQVKQLPILFVVSTLLSISQNAVSQGYEAPVDDLEAVTFAYADVLRSDPILESIQESRPREECRDISSSQSTRYENTTAGTVIGAIVGAAIGNQVGDGNGRRAAPQVRWQVVQSGAKPMRLTIRKGSDKVRAPNVR